MPRFCWDFSSYFFFGLRQMLTVSSELHSSLPFSGWNEDMSVMQKSLCNSKLVGFFFSVSFICCWFARHHHLLFKAYVVYSIATICGGSCKTVKINTHFDVAQIIHPSTINSRNSAAAATCVFIFVCSPKCST